MADHFVIKSPQGSLEIPPRSAISESNTWNIVSADIDGTVSDPNPIWESGSLYLHFYKSGANDMVSIKAQGGSITPYTVLPYATLSASYVETTPGDINTRYLTIAFVSNFTLAANITALQTGSGTTIWTGLWNDALSAGVITNLGTWEKPIDDNYHPDEPQGGEEAELTPITSESCLPEQIPDDPMSDDSSDPTHSNVKMVSGYLMTGGEVNWMGKIFWQSGTDSFIERLKDIFIDGCADPMAAIGGLIRIPISRSYISHRPLPDDTPTGIYLGGVEVSYGTNPKIMAGARGWITNRWVEMTYSKTIGLSFGTYYDYAKTRISIFLPYIGQVPLNTAMVMNGTIYANYTVDCFTGDLTCTLQLYKAQKNNYDRTLSSIIGRYKGNCALPVQYSRGNTEGNTQNIFNGLIGIGAGLVGAASGNPLSAAVGITTGLGLAARTQMDQKIRTESGGGLSASGVSGWLDVQYPYLIIERDVPLYPDNWRALEGAEQYATFTVGSLSGYTRFRSIHIEIAGATSDENEAIESILKQGVIL